MDRCWLRSLPGGGGIRPCSLAGQVLPKLKALGSSKSRGDHHPAGVAPLVSGTTDTTEKRLGDNGSFYRDGLLGPKRIARGPS